MARRSAAWQPPELPPHLRCASGKPIESPPSSVCGASQILRHMSVKEETKAVLAKRGCGHQLTHVVFGRDPLRGPMSSARRLLPCGCVRPWQPRDVIRDWPPNSAPVAGPDHLRAVARRRGVCLAPVVGFGVTGLNYATNLAAAVDAQCDYLLVERCPVRMPRDFLISAGVAHKDPAGPIDVAQGSMRRLTIRSQVGHGAVLEPTLHDVVLVGDGLADSTVDIAAVRIDRHVSVARPVMVGPVLDQCPIQAEDKAVSVPSRSFWKQTTCRPDGEMPQYPFSPCR